MNRTDIESFLRTLLLGDFDEHQNTSAQLVGGLISLVPVLDQVMDARDITGALFKINQRGGFDKATTDQVVNLGFAAFGAVPEVGSAFKTVFKPLWKERRAAKGAVNSGVQAVEGLLGLKKGGVIQWVRQELLGKWAGRTNQAIQQIDIALASCIELLEFMANASGWKDWLIPDSVQSMAKGLLPGMKALRGQVRAPLQRASNEIQAFLQDLLGEQAAAVVMAVGGRAAAGSAAPGSSPRTGHNAAESTPRGKVTPRQGDQNVGGRPETNAGKGGGPVHAAVQLTRKAFTSLANQEKGLVGEHMADYHELKRLGGSWPHDKLSGNWSGADIRKLNVDKRPVNLRLIDLPKVNHAGIDAVWQHGTSYTVTEAKARESVFAVKANVDKRGSATVKDMSEDHRLLYYLLSDSSDKRGVQFRMVQMSREWVRDRATREGLDATAFARLRDDQAARRVLLITFESAGALDHAQTLVGIHAGKSDTDVHPHAEHGITKQWEAAAIDAVVRAKERAREAKKSASDAKPADKVDKPTKQSKSSRKTGK